MIHELAMTANQLLRQLQLGKAEKKIQAVVAELRAGTVLLKTPKGEIEIPLRPGPLQQGEKVLLYFNERGNLMLETPDKPPRDMPFLKSSDVWNSSRGSASKSHVSDKIPEVIRDYETLLKKPLDARVLFARVLDVREFEPNRAGEKNGGRGWNTLLEYRGQRFELQTSLSLKPGEFYPFALEKSGDQFFLKKLDDAYRFPPDLKDILSRQGREPHSAYRLAWDKLLPLKSEPYFENAIVDFGDVIKNSGILSGYRSGQAVFDPPMGEAASRVLNYVFGLNYEQSHRGLMMGDVSLRQYGNQGPIPSSPESGPAQVSPEKVSGSQNPVHVNLGPASPIPITRELLEKILGAENYVNQKPEGLRGTLNPQLQSDPSINPLPRENGAQVPLQMPSRSPENPGMYLSQALEKLGAYFLKEKENPVTRKENPPEAKIAMPAEEAKIQSFPEKAFGSEAKKPFSEQAPTPYLAPKPDGIAPGQAPQNINGSFLLTPAPLEESLDKLLGLFMNFKGDEKWTHSKAQIWGAMAKFPALSLLFLNQHYSAGEGSKDGSALKTASPPGLFLWDLEKPLGPDFNSPGQRPLPVNQADSLLGQYQQLSREEIQAGGGKTEHSLFKFALQGLMSELGPGENQRGENWVQGYYFQGGEWRGLRFRFEQKQKTESNPKAKPLQLNIELTTPNLQNVWVAARIKPEGMELDLENEKGDVSVYMAEEVSVLEQNLKYLDLKVLRFSSKQRKKTEETGMAGVEGGPDSFFIKKRNSRSSGPGFDITA